MGSFLSTVIAPPGPRRRSIPDRHLHCKKHAQLSSPRKTAMSWPEIRAPPSPEANRQSTKMFSVSVSMTHVIKCLRQNISISSRLHEPTVPLSDTVHHCHVSFPVNIPWKRDLPGVGLDWSIPGRANPHKHLVLLGLQMKATQQPQPSNRNQATSNQSCVSKQFAITAGTTFMCSPRVCKADVALLGSSLG
jgi:hypothetical protein